MERWELIRDLQRNEFSKTVHLTGMSKEKHEISGDTGQNENCQELSMVVCYCKSLDRKIQKILTSDTIVRPRAMVVCFTGSKEINEILTKPSNTNIAQSAMFGAQWLPYLHN
jgi:hypothetical protein